MSHVPCHVRAAAQTRPTALFTAHGCQTQMQKQGRDWVVPAYPRTPAGRFYFSLLSLAHLWLGRIAAAERGGSLLSLVQIVTRWFLD